jgi:tetratricopeptide (TPR) repeat protein
MSVRLDDVLDYLGERCTPEREAEIEAALDDPDSGISRFLDALGQPKGYSCSLDLFEGVEEEVPHHQPPPARSTQPRLRIFPGNWKGFAVAAGVLLALLCTGGGTYAVVRYLDRNRTSSEVRSLVTASQTSMKQMHREEAIRLYSQAEARSSQGIDEDTQGLLKSLRDEITVLKRLNDLYIESNREYPNHAGIKRASDMYSEFFLQLGVLGDALTPRQRAAAVEKWRTASSFVVAGIDHWLSLLYLLPTPANDSERDERVRLDALALLLQQIVQDADESEPARTVRAFITKQDVGGMDRYFAQNTTAGLHPETVGQVAGFFLRHGRPKSAFDAANDAWWAFPNNATLNSVLEHIALSGAVKEVVPPALALQYSIVLLSLDPHNSVYWANASVAYQVNGNPRAAKLAIDKAFQINPKLPAPRLDRLR